MTWSDDESTIFYLADRDATPGTSEIYAVEAGGSGETMLYAGGPATNSGPAPSTAANKIVFSSTAGSTNSEIFVIDTNGAGLLQLTNDPDWDTGPVISPNATRVAWDTDRHNPPNEFSIDSEVYTVNVDGTGTQRITNTAVSNSAAAFSADATMLGVNRDSEASIMNADGTNLVELVPGRPSTSSRSSQPTASAWRSPTSCPCPARTPTSRSSPPASTARTRRP